MTDSIAPTHDFKLRRIILLDSYSPGGEAIVEIEDGAILTGENGSGKTSLLNMIPIFYGEHPSKCVSGSSSFSEFNLPHSTSYVIFEYVRRGVACMAVLFGMNESSFGYRFIRSEYDLSLFTEENDAAALVQEKDLKIRLQTAGVPHSNPMGHKEYRNIIQGMVVGSKQREVAEKRALVAEYAFTDSGSHLHHIEKIVSGMFTRNANFDDFLQVIVDYISSEGNAPISINGDKDKYADWPVQYEAYNEVMKHTDMMAEVGRLSDQIKAGDGALSVLHAKLLLLAKNLIAQQTSDSREKERLSTALATERAGANENLLKLQGDESKADADARIAEERVAAIDTLLAQYKKDAIEEKAAQVDALPQARENLALTRARKELLLGESLKIEQAYKSMSNDLVDEHLIQKQQYHAKIDQAREHYDPLLAKVRQDQQEEDTQLQLVADTGISVMREAHYHAIEIKAGCENFAANPIAEKSVVEALANKRAELEALREKSQRAVSAREKLQSNHTRAISDYASQESTLNDLKRQTEQVEMEIQQQLAHVNPDETSLLHFLRENKPDWAANIAKVIREDVLSMGDLSPSLSEGNSLYGINLDLHRLDGALCASEEALQEKVALYRTELEVLLGKISAAQQLLAKCNAQRVTAEDALKKHDSEIAVLLAKEKAFKAELRASEQTVEQSRKAAQEDALGRLEIAKLEVEKHLKHIQEAEQSRREARKACADKYANIETTIKRESDAVITGIRGEIAQAEKIKVERLKQYEVEKTAALSEKGVDTAMLKGMDAEIAAASQNIMAAQGWIEKVTGWRFWCKDELAKRDAIENEATQLRAKQKVLNTAKKAEEVRWNERQRALQVSISKIEESIGEKGRNQRQVEDKASRMDAYPPDRQTMLLPFDTSWSIMHLFSQSTTLEAERKQLRIEIEGLIRKIKSTFAASRGSPTEQFFLQTRSTIDPDDSDLLAWVVPLQGWYSRGHEDLRNTLKLYANTYGSLVTDFRDRLIKFHREVLRFNVDIQKALDQTSRFRRISNITIRFESKLEDLKYWKDVEDFTEAFQLWSRNSNEMPPPEFADRLKQLVSHWEMKEGIRAEPHKLINIRGEVVENGNLKQFGNKVDLANLSSTGLSYLILCSIFVAFLRKIRGNAKVQIIWAVDELLDLDPRNIQDLLSMLGDNGIRLFSACPEANLDILRQFSKKYTIQRVNNHPVLTECVVDMGEDHV